MTDAERQARCRVLGRPGRRQSGHGDPLITAVAPGVGATLSELIAFRVIFCLTGSPADNLQDSATAEASQAIGDLDLTELQAIVPPRGFGRDRPARRPSARESLRFKNRA